MASAVTAPRATRAQARPAVGAALAVLLAATASAQSPGADSQRLRRVGHLLSRAAHGPTADEVKRVLAMGIDAWIEEQLHPETIDESSNNALTSRVAQLMETVTRTQDRPLVARGELWRYHKGIVAPPPAWESLAFDDSGWDAGPSGFGYGDDDDLTILDDMRERYSSVFVRREFTLRDPELTRLHDLVLSVSYDDGFVAYLNGTEVARRNVPGSPGSPLPHTAFANRNHEAEGFEDIDLTARKDLLQTGENVLAFQVHNRILTSSDLSFIPQLLDRKVLTGSTRTQIRGIDELKALAHVYSIYSRRQLQTVLAEFWENHFTTDFDKVAEFLDGLTNSDASDALSKNEARQAAARLEHEEFEFLREHALGNFGDLLRYSATSPTMLIYLDNVLNVSKNANENYAREILELHSFGVDNGYSQEDIEQLSKCFTGWGVCKVAPEDAGKPHAPCGVQVDDTLLVAADAATSRSGKSWRYFKGTTEPPSAWKEADFDDSDWLEGPGGFGYGDDDDTTVLDDMRNRYTSVYLRKTFELSDPQALQNVLLSVDVDDGFVAYLNGHEAARFNAPGRQGAAVPFDARAEDNHEAGERTLSFNVNGVRHRLQAGKNVLAIQALNVSPQSSDLTMIPSLVEREVLPGSIENGDPDGAWSFHFFPELHNAEDTKTLFKSTPHQLDLAAGRAGVEGIRDAEDAIARILDHPSTAVFISCKLIARLVGDEIDFRKPAEGPYAALLERCVEAWHATQPKGDIRKIVKLILTSPEFWSDAAYRSKVKDSFEYIASTVRAVGAETTGIRPMRSLEEMGMELFTRDDPDGWPEVGTELMDTDTLRNRLAFARTLAESPRSSNAELYWDASSFIQTHRLENAEDVVSFFNDLLFDGTLGPGDRRRVREFIATGEDGRALPFDRQRDDFEARLRQTLGLLLSLPQWQFQ